MYHERLKLAVVWYLTLTVAFATGSPDAYLDLSLTTPGGTGTEASPFASFSEAKSLCASRCELQIVGFNSSDEYVVSDFIALALRSSVSDGPLLRIESSNVTLYGPHFRLGVVNHSKLMMYGLAADHSGSCDEWDWSEQMIEIDNSQIDYYWREGDTGVYCSNQLKVYFNVNLNGSDFTFYGLKYFTVFFFDCGVMNASTAFFYNASLGLVDIDFMNKSKMLIDKNVTPLISGFTTYLGVEECISSWVYLTNNGGSPPTINHFSVTFPDSGYAPFLLENHFVDYLEVGNGDSRTVEVSSSLVYDLYFHCCDLSQQADFTLTAYPQPDGHIDTEWVGASFSAAFDESSPLYAAAVVIDADASLMNASIIGSGDLSASCTSVSASTYSLSLERLFVSTAALHVQFSNLSIVELDEAVITGNEAYFSNVTLIDALTGVVDSGSYITDLTIGNEYSLLELVSQDFIKMNGTTTAKGNFKLTGRNLEIGGDVQVSAACVIRLLGRGTNSIFSLAASVLFLSDECQEPSFRIYRSIESVYLTNVAVSGLVSCLGSSFLEYECETLEIDNFQIQNSVLTDPLLQMTKSCSDIQFLSTTMVDNVQPHAELSIFPTILDALSTTNISFDFDDSSASTPLISITNSSVTFLHVDTGFIYLPLSSIFSCISSPNSVFLNFYQAVGFYSSFVLSTNCRFLVSYSTDVSQTLIMQDTQIIANDLSEPGWFLEAHHDLYFQSDLLFTGSVSDNAVPIIVAGTIIFNHGADLVRMPLRIWFNFDTDHFPILCMAVSCIMPFTTEEGTEDGVLSTNGSSHLLGSIDSSIILENLTTLEVSTRTYFDPLYVDMPVTTSTEPAYLNISQTVYIEKEPDIAIDIDSLEGFLLSYFINVMTSETSDIYLYPSHDGVQVVARKTDLPNQLAVYASVTEVTSPDETFSLYFYGSIDALNYSVFQSSDLRIIGCDVNMRAEVDDSGIIRGCSYCQSGIQFKNGYLWNNCTSVGTALNYQNESIMVTMSSAYVTLDYSLDFLSKTFVSGGSLIQMPSSGVWFRYWVPECSNLSGIACPDKVIGIETCPSSKYCISDSIHPSMAFDDVSDSMCVSGYGSKYCQYCQSDDSDAAVYRDPLSRTCTQCASSFWLIIGAVFWLVVAGAFGSLFLLQDRIFARWKRAESTAAVAQLLTKIVLTLLPALTGSIGMSTGLDVGSAFSSIINPYILAPCLRGIYAPFLDLYIFAFDGFSLIVSILLFCFVIVTRFWGTGMHSTAQTSFNLVAFYFHPKWVTHGVLLRTSLPEAEFYVPDGVSINGGSAEKTLLFDPLHTMSYATNVVSLILIISGLLVLLYWYVTRFLANKKTDSDSDDALDSDESEENAFNSGVRADRLRAEFMLMIIRLIAAIVAPFGDPVSVWVVFCSICVVIAVFSRPYENDFLNTIFAVLSLCTTIIISMSYSSKSTKTTRVIILAFSAGILIATILVPIERFYRTSKNASSFTFNPLMLSGSPISRRSLLLKERKSTPMTPIVSQNSAPELLTSSMKEEEM